MGKDRVSDKDKKTKHKKKKSKHPKKDKHQQNTSSESGSESEQEWIEASTATNEKRDEWMNITSFIPTVSSKELKRRNKKENEPQSLSTIDKPGQHERELNPYWKDGGIGLPSQSSYESTDERVLPEKTVGDAGLNWLRRAYKRIKEQAEEENRSMEEVAAERWGSLEKLEKLLEEAENKARENRFDTRHSKWKKDYRKESFKDENQNRKFDQFKKDKSDAYESYKKQFKKIDESVESYNRNFTSTSEPKFTKAAPKWMKKEFHNKYQVDTKEMDKNNDNATKNESPPEETRRQPLPLTDKEMNELGAKLLKAEMLGNLEDAKKLKSRLEGTRKAKEEEPSPKEVPLLTDKEMNELGAKLIKAEMLGNLEEVEKLKSKLEEARKVKESASNRGQSDETVLLVKTDSRGFTQPISASQTTYTGKKKKQIDTYDAGGKRTRYFPDDDKYSLKQMFEKERKTTVDDQNAEFARLFAKQSKDDDESFLVEAAKIKPQIKQEYRDRSQAIHEHMRRSLALGKCRFCLDSSHMKKHLIVSLGKTVYLSLPGCQSLVDYHCYIVPMAHVTSGTLLDEDVWCEIQTLKKCLIKMFEEMDKIAIFMETSTHHRWHPHCFIECIPVPREDGDMAPMYFKKAIMESETEWSLNKKLIDLYKKDLLHSVPKGLPYFSVEFGTSGGFAHVVEDEKLFPSYFGKEVVGGILDIEPVRWRKPPREPFENQSKKVLEFTGLWKKYDLLPKQ